MTASCRVCGRTLRSERYAPAGLGPVCARKVQAAIRPEPSAPRPAINHCPGQTALPLDAIPAAAVAALAAGLDDYRRTTPDDQQTPHGAAERAAEYLASSGYGIHIEPATNAA